jgi:MYXO-CTERM domain-containing protein
MSYASGGTSIAPHSIDAIAACVMTTCRGDCLSRASMSQWAPELCSATLSMATSDAGDVSGDGSADARTTDAGRFDDGGRGGVAPAVGCRCQTGGSGSMPVGGVVMLLAFALRRRPRR